MNGTVTYLDLIKQQKPAINQRVPDLLVGRKYQLASQPPVSDLHGICGGFMASCQQGGTLPPQSNKEGFYCFLWDSDNELGRNISSLKTTTGKQVAMHDRISALSNRFVLTNSSLCKPELQGQANTQQLTLRAGFEFRYSADVMNACLGVINLVESHCFAILEDGKQHTLQDSGEENMALYLGKGNDATAIQLVLQLEQDQTKEQRYEAQVTHNIPESIGGIAVESLTVLEQYQSFFMQRELPFTAENIWTPAYAPISWGWSMRIARRYDGEWGIARQKLLMPTLGQNGLEMPAWHGNIVANG